MILTILTPTKLCLKKNYVVENKPYSNEEMEKAERELFNRMHERWADTGEIWLVNEFAFPDDRVLLSTWAHMKGSNINIVMKVEGETE